MGVVSCGWRRAAARPFVVLVVLLGLALLHSSPALAISQRGHAFSFAFGSLADPTGVAVSEATGYVYVSDFSHERVQQFKPVTEGGRVVAETYKQEIKVDGEPGAIAVDNCMEGESKPCSDATDPSVGDVYVVGNSTKGNTEVYKFSPEGEAIGSIKAFEAKGGKAKKLAGVEGIAVDASGKLFVDEEGGLIYKFNNASSNEGESQISAASALPNENEIEPGFTVGSSDEIYIGATADAPVKSLQAELLKGLEEELNANATAAGVDESLTVIAKLNSQAREILTPALDYEISKAVAVNTQDVAENDVDERDDAYVVNATGFGVDRSSTIAEFSPQEGEHEKGQLIQRFGTEGLKQGDAIAVDPATGAVYVADAVSGNVDLFQLEQEGRPTIEGLSTETSPTVAGSETLSARVNPTGVATHYYFEYGAAGCVAASTCTKTAPAEAGSGFGDQLESLTLPGLAPGAYSYRIVAENVDGRVESPESTSPEQTFTVFASLGVLPDGRAWELVSPPDKAGAEPEAIRKEGGLVETSENGDAITYAADGPMPAGVEPEGNRSPEPSQILSVRDREAGHEGWQTEDITTANETGPGPFPEERWEYRFFSPNLALSLVDPFPAAHGPYARPPLSPLLEGEEPGKQENTSYLRDDAPIQPEASELASYEQAKKNGEQINNAGFLALIDKANAPGPGFGREIGGHHGISVVGATPDLSHVVFRSENVNPGLYEWSAGETGKSPLVSVLEDGEELDNAAYDEVNLGGAIEGDEPVDVRHAISNNGDRVFWTYYDHGTVHLEVRESGETATPETLQLDTAQEGLTPSGTADAVFQTASADGSKVFFTDGQRLTEDSGASGEHDPDLYVAELGVVGGHLKITHLSDLTALRDEGADVLVMDDGESNQGGGLIGASEDGSYVYFVANGALAPGAERGYCPEVAGTLAPPRPRGTTCNLYVRHYDEQTEAWEPTKLIAALSSEDEPDWGRALSGDAAFMTARVSPDGRYLAFMSDRSLTGYDNEDVSSVSPGERLDEEVFLYHAASEAEPDSESLVCASCNPSGARPTGVFDAGVGRGGTSEGAGLVVDRPEIWSVRFAEDELGGRDDHWLAGSVPGWTTQSANDAPYQSRYLSDSGRLFFNSADALVPLKTPLRKETVDGTAQNVGVENVYEYEPVETGGCHSAGGCVGLISSGESEHESAFLDASANGNDVFFLTAAQLVPQDTDSNFDVYDAHVCEEASPCPPPAPLTASSCGESQECQGPQSPYVAEPLPSASGTAVFSGPGNLVLPSHAVLPEKVKAPAKKPLTRAQKLAKALKACRAKHKKKKSERMACEKQARKKYGPVKKAKKASSSQGNGR